MSWRIIVISKRAKLDLQLGYMVVRSEEVTKVKAASFLLSLFVLKLTKVALSYTYFAML